jgi:phage-related protein (TIGR01555 family)
MSTTLWYKRLNKNKGVWMGKAKIIVDDEKSLFDSLENLVAQMGTNQDKRQFSNFVNSKNLSLKGNETELNALYRTEWIGSKIIDIIPNDMCREWRLFTGDIDPTIVKKLTDLENHLQLRQGFNAAHKWARLYGTGFLVMSIDDGQTPDKPLNLNAIKKGGLRFIHAIDRHRISHQDVQPVIDPLNPAYGMPEYYRFVETNTTIHHSRMLRFDGVKLPFDEFRRNDYFSDSILARLYDALINFTTTTQGTASMVHESNVDIVKVKGLMGYLQSAEGETLLRKRFTLAGLLKSFNNMMLLDSEEDFQQKTNTFTGLKDIMLAQALFLSGASDVPATRLLGSSASGLNATGEGDLKNYYDNIGADQILEYKPKLDYFDIIMAKSLGIPDGADLAYEFVSLFQMTPAEKAEIELKKAQRDAIYLDRNIVTESIIAKELRQTETYTNITDEYIKELEAFELEFDPLEGNKIEEDDKLINGTDTDTKTA